MNKVLLFFSGGNDSTLCATKLVNEGYQVHLVTFDNGCEIGIENVLNRVTALEHIYGKDKIINLGVFSSISEFMNLRYLSGNMDFREIISKYGNLNMNQINCLNCRSAMYLVGVCIARELGINYIADGARESQLFALEQDSMIASYNALLKQYNITLLVPVFAYQKDFCVENELMMISNHFFEIFHDGTVSGESKCILGLPMKKALSNDEIKAYTKFFNDIIKPEMESLIDKYPKSVIKEQIQNPTYTRIKFK